MLEEFSNRELAIGFWIIIFVIFAFSIKGVRKQFPMLLKAMFNKHLFVWYISLFAYFFAMIYFLISIGFWEIKLLKGTLFWLIGFAFVSSVRAIGKANDHSYFINLIKDNVKLFIVFQFIINLYSFSFIVEVILIFVITVLSILVNYLDNSSRYQSKEFSRIKNFFNFLLALIGLIALIYSTKMLFGNLENIVISDKYKEMFLPSILSLLFIFYIYLLVLYDAYLQVFFRLKSKKTIENRYKFILRVKIIILCKLNLNKVNNFIDRSNIMSTQIKSSEDVKKVIRNFKDIELYNKMKKSS
ncbi:hypothetical protein BKP45_04925 [Anaerobacillus alkalidiazotrophicus]|uniref:Uncharacterized protein n=1 Tax=Anaerobacillus alkalidiazotrophicus TaxID=472963 RepID=A0A1S2MC51_9BACI|nr:hypothetical protein [Anaerobacillus alkalidiazotrophicus]OIJ22023.1 hypothetical protein BKP45_04925 [Anaerobacillus alkalidiazotrophicus]